MPPLAYPPGRNQYAPIHSHNTNIVTHSNPSVKTHESRDGGNGEMGEIGMLHQPSPPAPPYRTRGRRRADPARTTRFLSQRRLVVHVAHAVTAAVAGRSFFLLLRNLGDEAFGGEQQAGDRGRILQRGAGDLLRVHDAGFDEVLIFSRRHVVSLVALAPLDFFNDD